MAKIINLFTGKPLEVDQDTEANDAKTSEEGKFIGTVPKDMARDIANHQALTEALADRIDELAGEYLSMLEHHSENIDIVLTMLGARSVDPESELVMVSEDGKVWVVPRKYEVICDGCGKNLGTSKTQFDHAICPDCYGKK